MIVDTHTHVISRDEARYPLSALDPSGGWYREVPVPVDELLLAMHEAGVDRAVLVQAVSAYRFDNRYLLDSARSHPAQCTSVACADLSAPGALSTVQRLLDGGVRGLRWWGLGDEPLAEPREVWDVAAAAGVPVVVTVFANRLEELDRLIPRLPSVWIALDHCAFADFSAGVPAELEALVRHPTVTLKVSTITLDRMAEHGDAREGLAELASRFGASRLMWGSDYSQTHDRPYRELVDHARRAASRLDDAARAGFLGGTALRLWPELAG